MEIGKAGGLFLGIAFTAILFITGCADGKQSEETYESSQQSESVEVKTSFSKLGTFEAETLGESVFTQDDLSKKDVTVINFWSLFCGPCIEEMPDLAEFEEKLPDNVQLLTVCLDGSGAAEEAGQILGKAGFKGTTLLAGDGDFQTVCSEIQYTPTTIFVDKDGKIAGDTLIGSQGDLAGAYTYRINQALKSMGKAEISIE